MKPIALDGFERVFAADPDPWRTFTSDDEARKRRALRHAIGPSRHGRMLEIAAGNGSNSRMLATRSLRLDATEATAAGIRLVEAALPPSPRARAIRLTVPGRFPRSRYDAIVIAVPHDEFRSRTVPDFVDLLRVDNGGGVLIDVRGMLDRAAVTEQRVAYWCL